MAEPFNFVCHARPDEGTVVTLADHLAAGPPSIAAWLDRRNIRPSIDSAAVKAYRNAPTITAASGIVIDALQTLDALAVADSAGILKPVRAAAAGET